MGGRSLAGILIANAVLLSALYLGRAVDVLQIRARRKSHVSSAQFCF